MGRPSSYSVSRDYYKAFGTGDFFEYVLSSQHGEYACCWGGGVRPKRESLFTRGAKARKPQRKADGRKVSIAQSATFPISYIADPIRVEACSVNPIDTKIRNGTYDDAPGLAHLFSPSHYFQTNGGYRLLALFPEGISYYWIRRCGNSC
jgi:hypothetical protein